MGRGRAAWQPRGAVVYSGQQPCGTCAAPDAVVPSVAADVSCGFINFFTSRASAAAWTAAHPEVTGQTLSQKKALAAGIQIFGLLLRAHPLLGDNQGLSKRNRQFMVVAWLR